MIYDHVTEHDIINKIKDFYIEYFKVTYVKQMKLVIDATSYIIYLDLNNSDKPLMIGGDFDSDIDFTNFIIKELKKRNLERTKYFTGQQIDLLIVEQIGTNSKRYSELTNDKHK